jgi:WD40 repeat protein
VASLIAAIGARAGQIVTGTPSLPADSAGVYSGVYASTSQEDIFSACDVRGIGSGWSIRFTNARDAAFLRYPSSTGGLPTLTHFIRVRGRVSDTGRFGLGFQNRELVVDSVLQVSESPQPCRSYEDIPRPWEGIPSSGARILASAVTDDRTRVAVLDLEAIISVWDVRRGSLLRQFPSEDTGHLSWASAVRMEFSRDGQRLAVGGTDGVVRVWNPADGRLIWTLAGGDTLPGIFAGKKPPAVSGGLAFNKSGTLLANMIVGKTAIWSMTSGTRIGTHEGGWGQKFLFLGDSSFVASGDSGLMRVYPRLGAAPIWRLKTPVKGFDLMERSSDARWLVVKSWDDTAHLWSLADGQPGARILIPYWFGRGVAAFSPDGKTIAMSGGANGLYLWETATGHPVRSFQKFPTGVEKAWFTSDGKSIVTHSLGESVFRVVHLDSQIRSAQNSTPVQASWGASSYVPGPGAGTVSSIHGFVRDSAGKVIVGADVSIFDGDRRDSKPIGRTSTNAAGRFLLQGIKARHVIVRAGKKGFSMATAYAHLPKHGNSVDLIVKRLHPLPLD